MGTQSDDDMIPEDLWAIKRFSEIGAKTTGYPAITSGTTSSTTRRTSSAAPRTGSTSTWALFWVVEIWAPNKEAGIADHKWIDWYRVTRSRTT